jgi:hypothetical protein
MILGNFRKKNHPIWSWHEGEKLVTSFSQRLKKEITFVHPTSSIAVR